ncbi:MAG: DMT family transporter [Deltaproteobacteria bacterium]|nr:DMT family transporter [Deltaproteobacteria bacterium]
MSEKKPHQPRLAADAALVLVTVFWGTTFALVKEALETTSPANFIFIRFSLALIMLLPVVWLKRRDFRPEVVGPGLIVGFFLFGAFLSQAFGLVYTTASRSGFITGLNVILVPLMTIFIFRQLPSRLALIGSVLAFGGLYLLTSADQVQGLPFNRGDALTILCAFMCAGHILSLGRYSPLHDSFWLTFIQFCAVTAGVLAWAAVSGELNFGLSPQVYGAAVYLAGACTIYAFWGQTWAQAYTSPTRTAIIFALEPVFAAGFAWLWLGEALGPWGLAGGGLIVCGILLAEIKPKAWSAD